MTKRMSMSRGRRAAALAVLACTAALAPGQSAAAYSERSLGTAEQIAWVRRAAANFVTAELSGDGAGACRILNAPLRASSGHGTCAQRWDGRLAALLRAPGARSRLRSEQRATRTARVVVHGDAATIELPASLIGGPNRFLWTENCWMLEG